MQEKNQWEDESWKFQFLTDVVTAAGLLMYGKRDKGLSERISKGAYKLRECLMKGREYERE
jgi:hypothetical protein